MISLQKAVQSMRPAEVVPVNSPVGESECNGRVENAIRRVQDKSRALRHQLETNMKMKILDCTQVMAWLVRWAAELISKYTVTFFLFEFMKYSRDRNYPLILLGYLKYNFYFSDNMRILRREFFSKINSS